MTVLKFYKPIELLELTGLNFCECRMPITGKQDIK